MHSFHNRDTPDGDWGIGGRRLGNLRANEARQRGYERGEEERKIREEGKEGIFVNILLFLGRGFFRVLQHKDFFRI